MSCNNEYDKVFAGHVTMSMTLWSCNNENDNMTRCCWSCNNGYDIMTMGCWSCNNE